MTEIQQPPPGWYQQDGVTRWWNGAEWTEHVAAAPHSTAAPQLVYSAPTKSVTVAYLLLLFLGAFAAHHFYLQRWVAAGVLLVLWWGGWLSISLGIPLEAPVVTGIGFASLFVAIIWCVSELFVLRGAVLTFNRHELERAALEREYSDLD